MNQVSPEIEKKCKHYRMSLQEYQKVKELLKREPQGVEWALFSALWSEHCSYKSSKIHLRKLFNKSPRVLEAEGENAGVIDLGEGEKIAFKMESHNHPSFIEPYQGAATGVGGILRDIFTMGARPIALADYLCFGDPKADRMSSLVNGVVRGIGGYGNCVGVPTITGRTEFSKAYNKNILVNAMAVGLFRKNDPIALSKAKGPGNWVVYVGAKTGKDGVHGASMASESFDSNNEAKKPNVQIGDPYFEKLLIESCIEVMSQNLVVAIQDMGAAGLTSSSFEMSSKGGVGMRMDLSLVPLRDSSMSPEEILLSESQERMLLVCEPEKFPALKAVFEKWGLDATKIGEIIKDKNVELFWRGENICTIDPDLLVENAPRYERPYREWDFPKRKESLSLKRPAGNNKDNLKYYLSQAQGGDRKWIYSQYDGRVGGKTVMENAESIGLLRLPDSGRGMAIVVGCRPHLMRTDAKTGAHDAILYPSLQMAAKGCEAVGVTDCLNFGNPEKPEIMSEFVASIEGLSEMARVLEAPIVSGNVSFYNETLGQNITSTPATGV
ncbi:MAG: phosphoribosylformylglycinamidine synthase subunit PurL, partial [Pseudobdellovibrionaceae bacterium]